MSRRSFIKKCSILGAGTISPGTWNALIASSARSIPGQELKGDIVIIGGGFAFTTLRSSIIYMLDPANRSKFKDIHVIYGARTPGMLLYWDELAEWEKRDDINMHITVDGTDDPNWKYNTGFVPTITEQKAPPAGDDTIAIICGPPIMIKFTQPVLDKLG